MPDDLITFDASQKMIEGFDKIVIIHGIESIVRMIQPFTFQEMFIESNLHYSKLICRKMYYISNDIVFDCVP